MKERGRMLICAALTALSVCGVTSAGGKTERTETVTNMRKIEKIIIHCTATPEGREVTAADVTRWHHQRGFRTIGYHWLIRLDGTIEAGRPESEIGAHCKGVNAHSIGVCYVGGCAAGSMKPKDTRTPAQRAAMRRLIAELKRRYPGATLHGHNEFAAKACPCFDIRDL